VQHLFRSDPVVVEIVEIDRVYLSLVRERELLRNYVRADYSYNNQRYKQELQIFALAFFNYSKHFLYLPNKPFALFFLYKQLTTSQCWLSVMFVYIL